MSNKMLAILSLMFITLYFIDERKRKKKKDSVYNDYIEKSLKLTLE